MKDACQSFSHFPIAAAKNEHSCRPEMLLTSYDWHEGFLAHSRLHSLSLDTNPLQKALPKTFAAVFATRHVKDKMQVFQANMNICNLT